MATKYVRKYMATPSEVRITGTEQWGCTGMEVVTCKYLWKIEDFSFIRGVTSSPSFGAKQYDNIQLQLFIKRIEQTTTFGVKLIKCDVPELCFKLLTQIVNTQGQLVLYNDKDILHTATISSRSIVKKYHLDEFIYKNLLPNDTLTFVCQIKMLVGRTYSIPPANCDPQTVQSNFPQYLWKLYQNGMFTDFTLVVAGKELNVHKTVLAAHSDVFTAMFRTDLEEGKSKRTVITDIELDVFEELLQFMYLGTAPNMKTMAAELMHAADKYAVMDLKKQCEIELSDNITTSTAVSILELAYRHSANELEEQAKCFIKDNIIDVIKDNGWKKMIEHFPDLVAEALSNIKPNQKFNIV